MPSSKRQRTDEPETEQPQDISQSASMWLDDGNIILMAQNTQFRVHRTVLAMHSTVFQDMFSVPQPEAEPDVDGCPVVHLSDSAGDVEHFLNALYKRSYYTKALPLDVLEAFLRLGHKYQVTHLRDEAIACIATEFPTTLQGWDDLKATFTTLDASDTMDATLRILRLAEEFRLFQHIPVLLLLTGVSASLEELCDGVPKTISTDTVLQVALANDKFRAARNQVTFAWLKQLPCDLCTTTKACSVAGKRLSSLIFFETLSNIHLLTEWENDWGKRLCTQCVSSAKAGHNAARSAVWDKLPKYCKLPAWDDLRNFE